MKNWKELNAVNQKKEMRNNPMATCYWCGKEVLEGEGAREHIVPKTLLQDVSDDVSDFILPAENAHEACNRALLTFHT